jgi:hypothetical protein
MPVLKDLYKVSICINACNPNKVYYLIRYKGRLVWRTIDKMKDCADMFCFVKSETFSDEEMVDVIESLAQRNPIQIDKYKVQAVPKDVTYLQVMEFIPTIEDGNMWAEGLTWADVQMANK